MNVTFKRYDTAEHLKTEEEIAAYLEAVSEMEDPALTIHALSTVARARNMSKLARDAELTREGLYKALSPDGNPSFVTVSKIAKAMGLHLAVLPSADEPKRKPMTKTPAKSAKPKATKKAKRVAEQAEAEANAPSKLRKTAA